MWLHLLFLLLSWFHALVHILCSYITIDLKKVFCFLMKGEIKSFHFKSLKSVFPSSASEWIKQGCEICSSSVVMEGREGHCQGDFWGWDPVWHQGAYVTGKSSWQRSPPPLSFAFILTIEIKISCRNYCSARRPNSAKSIASPPSGGVEGIWQQLFMSSTCSSGLQRKLMATSCDTCLLIDYASGGLPIHFHSLPSSNRRKWKRWWKETHKKN